MFLHHPRLFVAAVVVAEFFFCQHQKLYHTFLGAFMTKKNNFDDDNFKMLLLHIGINRRVTL